MREDHPADEATHRNASMLLRKHRPLKPGDTYTLKLGVGNNGRLTILSSEARDVDPVRSLDIDAMLKSA